MTNVILNILGEDILNSNYLNSKDCAITRALARAGFPELKDIGGEIRDEEGTTVINERDKNYHQLFYKVLGMYETKSLQDPDGRAYSASPIPIKDFSITLNLDI